MIRNGSVVDGTGNPWFRADVGIEGEKIVKIGSISSADAESTIDAKGLIVCPGFIDIHHHSDAMLLVNPVAESHVRQGVTTLCMGNCGESAAPLKGYEKERAKRIMNKYGVNVDWSTFGGFLEKLESAGVSPNVASLVGHGTVRSCVMGYEGRLPTSKELEEMKDLVDGAMKDGAFGLSTGLIYAPGFFSNTEEIKELCKVVARYHGIYATHMRDSVMKYKESVQEAIEIGRDSGVPVQISHIESHYPAWGQTEGVLKLVDEARAEGIDVACDVPPYKYSASGLTTLIPDWVQEGGSAEMKKRLANREMREKIRQSIMTDKDAKKNTHIWLAYSGQWDKIILTDSETDPSMVGQTIESIAKRKGVDPYELVFDLLLKEESAPGIITGAHNEDDICKVVSYPVAMSESDAGICAPYGALGKDRPHPRTYGTFPLAFRKYVRGETRKELPLEVGMKLLTDEEMVRKMTSLSAQRLQLRDRGMLREDFYADVVLFDPGRIEDLATYENPHQYPNGIEYVVVNGKTVVRKGEHLGAKPGKILRLKAE